MLVGATSEEQLRDLLAATQWKLSDEETEMLNGASAVAPGYPVAQRARFHPERNPARFG